MYAYNPLCSLILCTQFICSPEKELCNINAQETETDCPTNIQTETPRDLSNELQESPDITDLPSDSASRKQVKDVLQPFNCTEENKLTSTETIKSECPTHLRNRKQRKPVI